MNRYKRSCQSSTAAAISHLKTPNPDFTLLFVSLRNLKYVWSVRYKRVPYVWIYKMGTIKVQCLLRPNLNKVYSYLFLLKINKCFYRNINQKYHNSKSLSFRCIRKKKKNCVEFSIENMFFMVTAIFNQKYNLIYFKYIHFLF